METAFLEAASAAGARVLNGAGMCVHQAVEAFRCLTGVAPDLARLQRAFDTAVAARDVDDAEGPSPVRDGAARF
jgi:shikimate dehydrogenase